MDADPTNRMKIVQFMKDQYKIISIINHKHIIIILYNSYIDSDHDRPNIINMNTKWGLGLTILIY